MKNILAELPGVFDTAEATREVWLVLQSLEVAFREWVVVGDVRSAMRFGDAKIGKQEGGCLGFHRAASVGVEGELAGVDRLLGNGVVEQSLGQVSAFSIGDAPADHAAAEDVDDDV